MRRILLLLLLATSALAQPFSTQFEIDGMACRACEEPAVKALRKIRGVTRATVEHYTGRARIDANRRVSAAEIRAALKSTGFEPRFSGETPRPRLSEAERAKLDIRIASKGEAIDVAKHLARGKVTIFDFWAEWCGPCHLLTPKLERLVDENGDVALRTIDLVSWDSPSAKQATEQFRMAGLPYVRVYAADGKFVGQVVGNDIDAVRALVAKARKR